MLVERLRRHIADDFPSADFGASQLEILLYIDQALAFGLIGSVYQMAKIEGNLALPEGYLTTYQLAALKQDTITKEWYTTLPQPPISLPLGYSMDLAYFADSKNGRGLQIHLIRSERVAFRKKLPRQFGVDGWVEGSKFIMEESDGGSLLNQICYVRMASTRTSNLSDPMNLPDDAIEAIFNNVIAKLKDRLGLPKDIVLDDISAGNKAS